MCGIIFVYGNSAIFFFCADGEVLIILWGSIFVNIEKSKYTRTEKSAKHKLIFGKVISGKIKLHKVS